MTILQNLFYNINFKKNVFLPNNNKKTIYKIHETIKHLPCFNILQNKKLLEKTIKQTLTFSKGKKNFLIFGTGGSSLGSKALINIFFYDNIDPISFKNSIDQINLKTAGIIVISKSGSTPETLSQYLSIIEIFDQKNLLNILYRNSLIITEDKISSLSKIAHNNNVMLLNHEKDIGGRYSVFSNVGMVPAIIAGIDVKKIHLGAISQISKCSDNKFMKIAQFFRYQKINKHITNSVIMTYSDALFYFGKWYLQLWAESLGKENKGITAHHSVGTTDQHSQLQLYIDGPKDKFFTFISTNHNNKGFKLHNKTMQENDINFLFNKKMGDLMQAEQQATIETFKQKKFLFREINIPEINEFSIGQLMSLSILETIATCLYFEVNPFNQPAVEQGKKLTMKFLS